MPTEITIEFEDDKILLRVPAEIGARKDAFGQIDIPLSFDRAHRLEFDLWCAIREVLKREMPERQE